MEDYRWFGRNRRNMHDKAMRTLVQLVCCFVERCWRDVYVV